MILYTLSPSPLGILLLTTDGTALNELAFADDASAPVIGDDWRQDDQAPLLRETRAQLDAYFAGRLKRFDLPLAASGTPFQQQVWQALRQIPYGSTCSYADIARAIGQPGASRAVGGANGANPLAIVVPCHRVISANGRIGGYTGGLSRKQRLLALETRQQFSLLP